MRVYELPGLAHHGSHRNGRFLLVGAPAEKCCAVRKAPSPKAKSARLSERGHQSTQSRAVAPIGIEHDPFKVGGNLDIHRRRYGRDDLARLIGSRRNSARQNVVDIGRDHQPSIGNPMDSAT